MAKRSLRILCLGDSLTSGYTQFGLNHHPYHLRLEQKLREAFPGLDVEMVEDGVDGETTNYFSARMTGHFREAKENPFDWTIVLGGTNDLAYSIKPEQIFENLERTWSTAITRKSKVLALTVPELGSLSTSKMMTNLNVNRDRLNALIQGYTNKSFHALDFKSAFSYRKMSDEDRERYWDDGLHLTPDGYDVMGEIIAAAIVGVLKQEEAAEAVKQNGDMPGRRSAKRKRAFKDDDKRFEEESDCPGDIHRGYVVVRRKDLD